LPAATFKGDEEGYGLTAMRKFAACLLKLTAVALAQQPAPITIDYPLDGSIFPPDMAAPTFLWRDNSNASTWVIEAPFAGISVKSEGEPLRIGEIDPRAVSETNELPKLTPEQASAYTWKPDPQTWAAIKRASVQRAGTIIVTGFQGGRPVSRGQVRIQTSKDPVGAPIFYRDVPLMPSETEKGVIKPLARGAIPLINWRLRNISEPESRLLMTGLHTCANCHSFSRDGKTLGMDLDGPRNDKGMYALVSVKPEMSIRDEDVVKWTSFLGTESRDLRIGFMSQVSPDGQHLVTMINGPINGAPGENRTRQRGKKAIPNFYVTNFKNYGFLQVFYPTGGVLAWYSRAEARMQLLPGADDPRYVHTNAVWSPDGKYLVFARAEARDPYPEGLKLAEYANDPNETPIQYDLYRIPFNEGKGGKAEPIAGASHNGMSNSFPKISPDGRWIVFVQSRNGLLMRPDGKLFIVPAKGGQARLMRSNTPLMNSWHSFSPNGRWLVFSSKARSPYTQMYLTHLDPDGRDSPAILIENSTAANRAVNIPEFVNIPPDGLMNIDVPAVRFYREFDLAWELAEKGSYEAAVPQWRRALELGPADPRVHMNLGTALVRTGSVDDGLSHYRKALEIDPNYVEAYLNLGVAFAETGRPAEAIDQYRKALDIDPEHPEVLNNLGAALAATGRMEEAIAQYQKALDVNPLYPEVHNNLGVALARSGKPENAIEHFHKAIELKPNSAEFHNNLTRALEKAGKLDEASPRFAKLLEANPDVAELHNSLGVTLVWKRRPDEAIAHFEKALALNPALMEAHHNLGDTLYYTQGKVSEALRHWREALRLQPNHVVILDQTARLLATSPDSSIRNGGEAVELAERATRLTGGREASVLETLAAAYAEAGRLQEALETARRALTLALEGNKQRLAESIRARITSYEGKLP
jgi:tetratricopeptide (TPR) repeat protein